MGRGIALGLALLSCSCHWLWPLEQGGATADEFPEPVLDGARDLTLTDIGLPTDLAPAETPVNQRSIGTAGVLHQKGTISTASQRSVRFTDPLPASVGPGDRLTIGADIEVAYVQLRLDDTRVVLEDPINSYADQTFRITRAYPTLQAWEDDRQGDLVGADSIEKGIVYNDGPLTSGVTIEGSKTSAARFMWLTVQEGHRHRGRAGTGARIVPVQKRPDVIEVYDPYTVVEWLEIRGYGEQDQGNAGVFVGWTRGVTVRNCLIHDDVYYGQSAGVWVQESEGGNSVYNNLIYGGNEPSALSVGLVDYWSDTPSRFYSNTVFNPTGAGIEAHTTSNVDVRNNLVIASYPFSRSNGGWASSSDGNGSSDASAPGAGARHNLPKSSLASTASGSEDLHLSQGSGAIDVGVPLLKLGTLDRDVDDQARPHGLGWDIGADEAY